MWRKIGIIIGGAILIWIVWFCGLAIETIILKFLPSFNLFPMMMISHPLIAFFSCWFIGQLVGRKFGEKGWLYGGLPTLILIATTRLLPGPAESIFFELKGHYIYIPMPVAFSFSILAVLAILSGIVGGMYGEKIAKRRKARI